MPTYQHPQGGDCTTTSNTEIDLPESQIELFPNPTQGSFSILAPVGTYQIEVMNAQGKRLRSLSQRGNRIEMDISNLPAGIYFIRIRNGKRGEIKISKIIKSN